ncbi:hypothetical protein MAN88_18990 [Microcystis aeruginosa]|nr:hypothetical protein MAN88_18990 [Microcystis aeruginosa]
MVSSEEPLLSNSDCQSAPLGHIDHIFPEAEILGSSVCVMQWTGVIRGETLI